MLGTLLVVFLIRDSSLSFLVRYVDPVLVLLVGGVTLGIPVRLAWLSLLELLNRAPSESLVADIRAHLAEAVAGLPVQQLTVRVLQPGRTRIVAAHMLLKPDYDHGLGPLDDARAQAHERLQAAYPLCQVDLIFTQDPRWSAPMPEASA